MLRQETVEVLNHFELLTDYEEAILYVLDYIEKNKHILSCADSTAADGAEALFLDRPLSDCGKCHSESEENLHLRISCLVLHRGSGWGVNGKGTGIVAEEKCRASERAEH